MKIHTDKFKNEVKLQGREIDSKITFEDTILGKTELNAVTPSFQGAILKSVMKQLEIDSNIEIPEKTILRYEFGVKVNGEYEYINFGNYIVKTVEKQENTRSYKITCYDKMLYSMIDYKKMPITYPISIRDYINSICEFLGLTFKNENDTFANYNRMIQNELYLDSQDNSLGYTFRDVLDELAQATGSTICINENDELEIRYINNTSDTIDEEFLKDINVNFGEKYGPVNSIVLSRSAESDNVYLRDEQSISKNGLCELKIVDNQIMNFNDRSDYLPDLLYKLNGLEYYLNDYSSTGITYYDLCDRYSVKIADKIYSCIMFNDEINVTQGLQENVFTEMPQETQTDYTKADKTDRKINQTYLIVDKQNQKIESVVSQTDAQNQKIAQVTQTVDELNSKISDIADITISAEDTDAKIELNGINESEPIRIVVRPIAKDISNLLISSNMLISDKFELKQRVIRFTNTTTNKNFDYPLPDDLLYYDSENYDEFILDYDGQSCVINKKVGYNADGSKYLLDKITTIPYEYPKIVLTDGDYIVSILGHDTGYIFTRLMTKNIYTTQFYTKAETDSEISQSARDVTISVDEKLSNYSTTNEMNSAISLKANEITSSVSETYTTKEATNQLSSKVTQTADSLTSEITARTNGDKDLSSKISQNATDITAEVERATDKENSLNANIQLKLDTDKLVTQLNASADVINIKGNRFTLDSTNFKVSQDGTIKATNGEFSGKITASNGNIAGWEITSHRLFKQGSNYRLYIEDGDGESKGDFLTVTNGSGGGISVRIKANGYAQFTNADITGKITATSGSFTGTITSSNGKIGGWNLTTDRIYGNWNGSQYSIRPYGVSNDTTGTSQSWQAIMNASSDVNLKNNIKEVEDIYEKFFDNLKPVTFNFNKGIDNGKEHIGFIAQDIIESEKLIDKDLYMIEKSYDSEYYNLYKQELIALNTWQIQKLKKQIQEQNELINQLITRIEKIEKDSEEK